MAIRFELADGTTGTLDVAKLLAEEAGADITGIKDGMVMFRDAQGNFGSFGLGQWAETNQATIITMDGFNSPETALDTPPNGMNYMDQSVFFHDGKDMDALSQMFPKNMEMGNGRIVVMDNDGLWKTMWSPYIHAPQPLLDDEGLVSEGLMNDPKMTLRSSGVVFLLGLAGIEATTDEQSNFKVDELVAALETIQRNAPFEVRDQIAKLMEQTTGIRPHKFMNALLAPREVGAALLEAKERDMGSFNYRMMQLDMAETIMKEMQADVRNKFMQNVVPLTKLSETNNLLINLKQVAQTFIQTMIELDLLRDISRVSGINEWIAISEDQALDKSRLPDMPEFIPKFIKLQKWLVPVVEKASLGMARGRTGFKACVNLLLMIDDCIFALQSVPEHSAKFKMMMALKRLQAGLETKLVFVYQPDPLKNKSGLKENPFMQAKEIYGPPREALYKAIQNPKESWNQILLAQLADHENVERFYDTIPEQLAKLWKAFAAMDAAYDMQPWIDVNHAARTHDAFSEYHPAFGERPPEAGYLSKNSHRAIGNIAETLVVASATLQEMGEKTIKELLRNPFHFALFIKSMMVASVNREIGTVEILSKFGIEHEDDTNALPDPNRMWEDPEHVQMEMDQQIEELMGALAMEQMAQGGGGQQPPQGPDGFQAPIQEEGAVPKAGNGPMGPPQQAVPMRR